jgi:hypothetical protein
MGRDSFTQDNAIGILLKLLSQARDSMFGYVVLSNPEVSP